MTRVSTCMATYNGAAYIKEQIDSVLRQLGPEDELVVVDDGSSDDTVDVVRAVDDPRVRLHEAARNQGHVATFEMAIRLAAGEFLLLCDQDDLWPTGRVETMLEALRRSHFVAGNQHEFPRARPVPAAHLEPWMERSPWRNMLRLFLGRQPYFGCAMGFRREILAAALPFPRHVEAHDHWLPMVGNAIGPFPHLADVVVLRRVHDHNQTPSSRRPLPVVVRSRLWMLVNAAHAWHRARRLPG